MTAEPTTRRAAYCLRCARPAESWAASMDRRYPLVTCRWTDDEGKQHGHGTLPGTHDRADARASADEYHRQNVLRHHSVHLATGRAHPDCAACDRKPPPSRATIHPYQPLATLPAAMRHLEYQHHDRTFLGRYPLVKLDELRLHHRKLHGEPVDPR